MNIDFEIGLNAISSYRRLAYTPWHAIAEFIDNSTQSYLNNRQVLEQSHEGSGTTLDVGIVYDRDGDKFSIADNAMGMDLPDLQKALRVGIPPANPHGRSKYGLGMKTAACWIGGQMDCAHHKARRGEGVHCNYRCEEDRTRGCRARR